MFCILIKLSIEAGLVFSMLTLFAYPMSYKHLKLPKDGLRHVQTCK